MDEQSCDCCEGTQVLTPVTITNRPGLAALAYRVGTHARFFETMKAKLSSQIVEVPRSDDATQSDATYPLRSLATRASDDASIALLDGWATVADVLTFYQQRIANEGYLRTATERRSVLELARLVGYQLRPGVASTVFLAYTIDENHKVPTEIPIGARSQSVPNPGELPQAFETSEVLDARASWNTLRPRMSRPQIERIIRQGQQLFLSGVSTNLKEGDPLLIDFGSANEFYRIRKVEVDAAADRTRLELDNWFQSSLTKRFAAPASFQNVAERYSRVEDFKVTRTGDIAGLALTHLENLKTADAAAAASIHGHLTGLLETVEKNPRAARLQHWLRSAVNELGMTLDAATRPAMFEEPAALSAFEPPDDPLRATLSKITARPSVPPRDTLSLDRKIDRLFPPNAGDAGLQVLGVFNTELAKVFPLALANTQVAPDTTIKVYALRLKAALFGHNAAPRPVELDPDRKIPITDEWTITNPMNQAVPVADFNFSVDFAHPLTLRFTDTSKGDVKSYHWDFGDGATSAIQNPTHTYAQDGNYTITLSVTGAGGSSQKPKTVTVGIVLNLKIQPAAATTAALYHEPTVIFLDTEYDIAPQSWVVIVKPENSPGNSDPLRIKPEDKVITQQSLVAYGLAGKSTRIDLLNGEWFTDPAEPFSTVRGTSVYAQTEELALAQEPIEDDVCNGAGDGANDWIELDDLYTDLKSGRWLVVSGERTDVKDAHEQPVPGVRASELVMLTEVIQDVATEVVRIGNADISFPYYYESGKDNADYPPLPAPPSPLATDRLHTWIRLATKLEYCYRRDTVTIYGNVVKATNGETRNEILGNGDGSRALQSFDLKQPPLTYVAAPNPAGVDSTLHVYVNDVEWHEAADLVGLGRTDHQFITRTNDEGKTTVIFGNGQQGSRLPTGAANVRAVYRNGIGAPGNVQAEQISLLVTRPLGVKAVINPLRASGGADKEARDQARKNVPLAVTALDRLVSVQDYADFTRIFAGIAKAAARRMPDGKRELVHVTIAGVDDVPIDPSSDLYRNLGLALRSNGDPDLPVQIDLRELLLLVISAKVYLQPDYVWEKVVSELRTRLLDTFGFDRRELGQDAVLSEVLAVMQAVRGVAYVDVDVFDVIPEKIKDGATGKLRLRTPKEISDLVHEMAPPPGDRIPANLADMSDGILHAAQLAFLSPLVPDTLVLNRG